LTTHRSTVNVSAVRRVFLKQPAKLLRIVTETRFR